MPIDSSLIIYATNWCPDCRRVRAYLDSQCIPYQWIDISGNKEAIEIVKKINDGFKSVPTILFPDGSILVEPTIDQLISKLETPNQ